MQSRSSDGNDRAARRSDTTFNKASRWAFASGDGTRPRTCLMRPAQARESNTRLNQTRRPVNQSKRVCVEMCPLTTRRSHTPRGQLREREATYVLSRAETTPKIRRDVHLEAERSDRRARSRPHSGPLRERTKAGRRREREQPEQPSSEIRNLHAQHAEEEEEWCWVIFGPRGAREGACGGKHVGQHVNVTEVTAEGGGKKRTERADPQRVKERTYSW